MSICTYLSSSNIAYIRSQMEKSLDPKLKELVNEINLIIPQEWLIEQTIVHSSKWFRVTKNTLYTILIHISEGEWQAINLVSSGESSICTCGTKEQVGNFLMGFLSGVNEQAPLKHRKPRTKNDIEYHSIERAEVKQVILEFMQKRSFYEMEWDGSDVTVWYADEGLADTPFGLHAFAYGSPDQKSMFNLTMFLCNENVLPFRIKAPIEPSL